MTQPAPLPATAAQTSAQQPWPVRVLTAKLSEYLGKAPAVWVEGQVVQLTRRPGQRLAYLTLRDMTADLSFSVTVPTLVLDSMPAALADGAQVVIHASVNFYGRQGKLSLAADQITPVGVGDLLARIEQLRQRLAAEGLFAAERKKPLPFLPRTIGVVCGRASAAEKDVVENAQRRWPAARFDIRTVAVQGPTAGSEVIAALRRLDADEAVEVIVVARGGGSTEDLLPFSSEELIRAVAACRTPVVSAIGHEIDSPLLDLVADVRASTPTDAGKRVAPDVAAELDLMRQAQFRVRTAIRARIAQQRDVIAQWRSRPVMVGPQAILIPHLEALAGACNRMRVAIRHTLSRHQLEVKHLAAAVKTLSPGATISRGYAVVLTPDGHVVTGPAQAPAGTALRLRLSTGTLGATSTGPVN